MTEAELRQLVDVLVVKVKGMGERGWWESEDEWLRGVIGTCVVDTMLCIESETFRERMLAP